MSCTFGLIHSRDPVFDTLFLKPETRLESRNTMIKHSRIDRLFMPPTISWAKLAAACQMKLRHSIGELESL